jgi:DNA-binding transcriptional MerR regulator
MSARGSKELAESAGVSASFVDRLVDLGILAAAEDGSFSDADVYRVRFVESSDRGGLSVEAIARAIHEGRFSLAFLDGHPVPLGLAVGPNLRGGR